MDLIEEIEDKLAELKDKVDDNNFDDDFDSNDEDFEDTDFEDDED